jgi:hypothetical protein
MAKPPLTAICLFGEAPVGLFPWWRALGWCHVFFHFYSYRTVEGERVPITDEEKEALVRLTSPTDHVFDDGSNDPTDLLLEMNENKRFFHDEEPRSPAALNDAPLFYSLMRVAHLRRTCEISRDTDYGRCVAAASHVRPTFHGALEPTRPMTLFSVKNGYAPAEHQYTTSPEFFYADSATFDLMASHFRLKRCYKEFMFETPETDVVFQFHMRALRIANHPVKAVVL